MKGKLILDGVEAVTINSNEYDEIMEFLYKVRTLTYKIEDEVYVQDPHYKYEFGIID